MIPILYSRLSDFKTTGILGALPDVIKCTITEERNGIFVANFSYPDSGENADLIDVGCFIGCSYNSDAGFEYFEICTSSKTIAGITDYECRHYTYSLLFNVVAPPISYTGTPVNIFSILLHNLINASNVVFESNISATKSLYITAPAALRSCLGGMEGSMLDLFGGEFEWTHDATNPRTPKIIFNSARGADNNVWVSYGLNVTNYKQDKSIEDTADGVILYYYDTETNTAVMSDPQYITGHTEYRIALIDVSDQYETAPTVSTLNTAAVAYLSKNNVNETTVNIDISFVNLRDTEEYREIKDLEDIRLCDIVHVQLGNTAVTSKVIKVVYNVLLDKYDEISISDPRKDLVTTIIDIERAL